VCSSRPLGDGVYEITTPAPWCKVGHRLYEVGSAASYGVRYADWVDRLLRPHPNGHGRANGFGPDARVAEERLIRGAPEWHRA
jgi:hypothetical protein